MGITTKEIKFEFKLAESALNFCWTTLTKMHDMLTPHTVPNTTDVINLISFQDQLATTIFRLQSIRERIIIQEKKIIENKRNYNQDWFVKRLRLLSKFKDGIDKVVNISKSFGDAYAYFFYKFDLELLSNHYSHKRIVNNCAGIGELGELQFIKKIKHVNGNFTIFHGITNILRFGDFSFFDFKTLRIAEIGELKTKKDDGNKLILSIKMLKRPLETDPKRTSLIKDIELQKTKKGRQLLGIANLLNHVKEENSKQASLSNKHYGDSVQELISVTKNGMVKTAQVSPGLAFVCVKLNKANLYNRIFNQKIKQADKMVNDSAEIALKLVKKDSPNNSIILGQLLYDIDYTDKNGPGTVPLFWHPIKKDLLKHLYFGECIVMSIFNPTHLVMEIEEMGYVVESKYATRKDYTDNGIRKTLEKFDLFISKIINFLMAESFVVSSLKEIEKIMPTDKETRSFIHTQQHFN